MPPQIRTEFRKLATIRSPWLLLAAGPVIVVAGITGLVLSGANVHDPAAQGRAMAHVGLAAVFTLIFGILAVAGEYRHGTITSTFLVAPDRRRVLVAKAAAHGIGGLGVGIASAAIVLAISTPWLSGQGHALGSLGLGAGGVAAIAAGSLAYIAISAVLGGVLPTPV